MSEVIGCQQAEIDRHRWYVDIRFTLEDGTDVHKVFKAGSDGIEVYDSVAEYEDSW